MWKKLQAFIKEMDAIDYSRLTKEEKKELRERLLTEIAFFQHERLIHLIVTVTFAVMAILTIILIVISSSVLFAALELLFAVLLVPYIIHYYHLENGVQHLYRYYDRLV